MRSIIFANGEYCPSRKTLVINENDLIIAADGGSRHCQLLGIQPDILIGDLDSTTEELLQEWETDGIQIIRFPAQKDQTDLELALFHAQASGAEEIIVFGAVGGRLDMTFGNLLLLTNQDLTVPIQFVCDEEEVQVLRSGESLSLTGNIGDTVSLLSLQPGISNITTLGLKYSLDNEPLEFGLTRGISNLMEKKQAVIEVNQGLLAVIHTRQIPAED